MGLSKVRTKGELLIMKVYKPKIMNVTLSPNPVNINSSLFVSVIVTEVEMQKYQISKISGRYKSGESVSINVHKEVV